jgi:hypothetical protein
MTQEEGKGKDYEAKIVEYLQQFPSGLTITDIHNGITASRITVSKYISVLEARDKVFSKKIGAYKLYFASERNFVPKTDVLNYYAGLLSCFKSEIPDIKKYKEFGYIINEYMKYPMGSSFPEDGLPWKGGSMKKFFEYYASILPYLDFTFDNSVVIEEEISDDGNSAILRLKNLKIFDVSENFDVHFHIATGITEKAFSKMFRKEVVCTIKKIDISEKTVEMSIEIKE